VEQHDSQKRGAGEGDFALESPGRRGLEIEEGKYSFVGGGETGNSETSASETNVLHGAKSEPLTTSLIAKECTSTCASWQIHVLPGKVQWNQGIQARDDCSGPHITSGPNSSSQRRIERKEIRREVEVGTEDQEVGEEACEQKESSGGGKAYTSENSCPPENLIGGKEEDARGGKSFLGKIRW